MFQKTREIKEGKGIMMDSLGVIYHQTDNGLIVEGLDEYSALKARSGWYVDSYTVRPGVTEIAANAFSSAHFKNISLPNGLQSIYDYSFAYNSLEEIVIPDSVSYIGAAAFLFCTSLRRVTLPDNIDFSKELEPNPFAYNVFLAESILSLEYIKIPKEKRNMLEEKLPHLKHLFIDK